MQTVQVGWKLPLVLAVLAVGAALLPAPIAAADDVDWRAKALALNDITGDDPIKGMIQTLKDDATSSKKLLAAAVPLAKEKNQPFGYNAAYILARAALQVKDYEAGQLFYRVCGDQGAKLRSPQKLVSSYLGLIGIIDLLYRDNKYEQSAKLSQSFLETLEKSEGVTERLKQEVLRRMIRALAKQGKNDEANRMVETLLKARGNDWRNLELKAWLQREQNHMEESVKLYEDLIAQVEKDKSLEQDEKNETIDEIRYILSGVYVDMNKIDKAGEQLKTLLATHPDDPTYNNDLGYIWADHDMNLDEAEKMIRKALEEDRKLRRKRAQETNADNEKDKDNSAFLDSLGWVLFKQKKYQDAKPILLKAIEDKEGQHIEIYDHLGDVHQALGEKSEAIAVWEKGVKAAGPTKREQERKTQVEKKLRQNQVKAPR
jgi:tetratricopeptide (TPR) repeat protein